MHAYVLPVRWRFDWDNEKNEKKLVNFELVGNKLKGLPPKFPSTVSNFKMCQAVEKVVYTPGNYGGGRALTF